MKLSHYLLLPFVCTLFFSINAHSSPPTIAQAKIEINKIINDWDNKFRNNPQPSNTAVSLMEKDNTLRVETLREVDTKMGMLPLRNKTAVNKMAEINFLDLQLDDAIVMLEGLRASVQTTLDMLHFLEALALDAMNGTLSSSELEQLNIVFQQYKDVLNHVHVVALLNGTKRISDGDITIQLGNKISDSTSLTIKMPAFNLAALSLDDTDLSSAVNAAAAFNKIQNAFRIINKCQTIALAPSIDDAEAMLLSVPFVLHSDFIFMTRLRNLAMEALNGGYPDEDREAMDAEFDYLKSALTKAATYVSLSGPKLIAGGDITITIGHHPTPENTLVIKLPITGVSALGLEELNVKSRASAAYAFNLILGVLHDFVYGKG